MIYLITYDLRNGEKDYSNFYSTIKNLGHWWHYIKNTWIVKADIELNECTRQLREKIDDDDRLLIVEISNIPMNGWLPEEAWRWILKQKQS